MIVDSLSALLIARSRSCLVSLCLLISACSWWRKFFASSAILRCSMLIVSFCCCTFMDSSVIWAWSFSRSRRFLKCVLCSTCCYSFMCIEWPDLSGNHSQNWWPREPRKRRAKEERFIVGRMEFYTMDRNLVKVAGTLWMRLAQDRYVWRTWAEAYVQ